MAQRNLSPILYTIFMTIFVTIFVVAIGALLQITPFDRIDPSHRDRLFLVVISAIAIIGVNIFRHMPKPYSRAILRYEVKVTYRHYSGHLKNALSEEQKDVWNRYLRGEIGSKPSRKEQAIISEIKTAELNDGQHASGEMYLNFDSGSHWLEGSLNYRFPGDQFFTHIPVVGKYLDDKILHLELSQPERFFWDEDELRVRSAANYSIQMVRDGEDSRILTGTLAYPHQKSEPTIEAAKVTCIAKD